MNLKQFLYHKVIAGRKPWSIVSDVLFFGLLVMLLIPTTRSTILSGVAVARTWITNPEIPESKRVALGPLSLDSKFINSQGMEITLGSLKSEVIFLNQWATWCPPCRAEMPAIERLYKEYGSKVKFIILTSEDPSAVKKFIEKEGYTFPIYYGSVNGPELVSHSIPSTVIIDRSGKIAVQRKGAFNWSSRKIKRLLRELSVD